MEPQFHNEINTVGRDVLGEKHETGKKIFEWTTGQKPSSIADAFSRKMVLSMAYHFWKQQGLSDTDIYIKAAETSDKTMVQYGREQTSPVLQKLGMVGQLIAPLQKYPIAQMANLINDIRFVSDQKTVASLLPAMSTVLTSMIMGGAWGTAMYLEYELLRQTALRAWYQLFGDKENELFDEAFPPLSQLIMESRDYVGGNILEPMYRGLGVEEGTAKTAAQYGAPTAATGAFSQFLAEQTGWDVATRGWDIGSGLRFQPMLAGLAEGKEMSPLDAMAVAKWWVDQADAMTTFNKTQAEERRDMLKFAPFVGSKALLDRYGMPE
jgi:hypothetical protein